jgi:hypothetical protein
VPGESRRHAEARKDADRDGRQNRTIFEKGVRITFPQHYLG